MPKHLKKEFLLNEIWMLSINAAFQRANVYKDGSLEKERSVFKQQVREFVATLAEPYYSASIDDEKHIANIYAIVAFSKAYAHLLTNGSLNFGVSQKLFNLYLKYLWCLDVMELQPPHFPVDRIIQSKLKIAVPTPWTQMIDETAYKNIIDNARRQLIGSGYTHIAELELHHFNRRQNQSRSQESHN
jgi:hypothetical protein